MPRWNKGSNVIERLLDSHHLDRVPTDDDTVAALVATARRHIASAPTTVADDPDGALALAYDACRRRPRRYSPPLDRRACDGSQPITLKKPT